MGFAGPVHLGDGGDGRVRMRGRVDDLLDFAERRTGRADRRRNTRKGLTLPNADILGESRWRRATHRLQSALLSGFQPTALGVTVRESRRGCRANRGNQFSGVCVKLGE